MKYSGFLKIIFTSTIIVLCLCSKPEIQHQKIVPGIIHSHIYDDSGPWSIHVLDIDLNTPGIDITTVKARNLLQGNEKTSEQALRSSGKHRWAVAAINADFYGQRGIPVGAQIVNGIPVKAPSHHPIFAMSPGKKQFIETVTLDAKILTNSGTSFKIDGINRPRYDNEIIFFNEYAGTHTNSNNWGTEINIRFIEPFAVGKSTPCVVTQVAEDQGNQPIPANQGGVLSAHGTGSANLKQTLNLGDTLVLTIQFPPVTEVLQLAVGGLPRIIRDGRISIELDEESVSKNFSTTRHPRTALGYTRDGTHLILVTVDGRQPDFSVGMTLEELAQLMLDLDCYQALNLDGGGSTTMVINNNVVNRPSDATGERAVANALVVLSSVCTDTTKFISSKSIEK